MGLRRKRAFERPLLEPSTRRLAIAQRRTRFREEPFGRFRACAHNAEFLRQLGDADPVCLFGVEKRGLQFTVSRLFLAHRDFKLLETPVCVVAPALQFVKLAIELRFARDELIVERLEGSIFLRQ